MFLENLFLTCKLNYNLQKMHALIIKWHCLNTCRYKNAFVRWMCSSKLHRTVRASVQHVFKYHYHQLCVSVEADDSSVKCWNSISHDASECNIQGFDSGLIADNGKWWTSPRQYSITNIYTSPKVIHTLNIPFPSKICSRRHCILIHCCLSKC